MTGLTKSITPGQFHSCISDLLGDLAEFGEASNGKSQEQCAGDNGRLSAHFEIK